MKGRLQTVRCSGDKSRRDGRVMGSVRRGFSILELLIVVAILLTLTTVYWGASSGSAQKKRLQSCRNNLQKIFVAMQIYTAEQAGNFPYVTNANTSAVALNVLVPRYTADTTVFICPGSRNPPQTGSASLLEQKISYAYYMGRRKTAAAEPLLSDKQVDTLAKTPGQILFSPDGKPPGNNHHKYGGNVLFCDGRTEPSPVRAAFSLGLTQGVVLLDP